LKATKDRQKSWANSKQRLLEFQYRENVYLKVSPIEGVLRFGKSRELSPRYVGPYKILERLRDLAYQLPLPLALSRLHDVFHVSQLRKYISDLIHVLEVLPLRVQEDLTNKEVPVMIVDRKVHVLRRRSITYIKVHW
jgi:hypothetical protein